MYLTIVYILDIYKIPYLKKIEEEKEAPITVKAFYILIGSKIKIYFKSLSNHF